ncbi:MAG: diacylglycerol/lipid kinase family protein [Chthoniobacterales bacterium]
MPTFVIVNPRAGAVTDLAAVLKQLRRLRAATIAIAPRRGDTERLCRSALRAGFDYFVAAGGDGTLNELVNSVARSRRAREIRIGVAPVGTGNDFARTLGLPTALRDNIHILNDPAAIVRQIDLVRVKADRIRYFVNVAAGGFSGMISEKLTRRIKQSWGPLAYLLGAAAALPKLHSYPAEIVLDDATRFSSEIYNVIVANGRYAGGGVPVAPEADPTDGLLDVILIPRLPGAELAVIATEILLGTHLSNSEIIHRRATQIAIRSRPRMFFSIDGEPFAAAPLRFQIIPRALNFVTAR